MGLLDLSDCRCPLCGRVNDTYALPYCSYCETKIRRELLEAQPQEETETPPWIIEGEEYD